MWKVALAVVLLAVAGHFAVRYIRTNPLDPVFEGNELVVETVDHTVRYALDGPVEGTYVLVWAESRDWTNVPANLELSVVPWSEAQGLLSAHPELLTIGDSASERLSPISTSLALIAVNRLSYGDLRALLSTYQAREESGGERLCVTLGGDALVVASAIELGGRSDVSSTVSGRLGGARVVLTDRVEALDCASLLRPN